MGKSRRGKKYYVFKGERFVRQRAVERSMERFKPGQPLNIYIHEDDTDKPVGTGRMLVMDGE